MSRRPAGPWALLCALLLAVPDPARSTPSDPTALQAAWSSYARREAQREPEAEFPYEFCFRRAAAAHGLPVTLLVAVARGESSFRPWARSPANAYGLMQILWPDTANELGIYRLADLYDPCTNVEAGARYLRKMRDRYDGDLYLALAAYNYGPNRIPRQAQEIPRGATWYAGYIYRHLRVVLGEASGTQTATGGLREQEGRRRLATFHNPIRAEAYAGALRERLSAGSVEVLRSPRGYDVFLAYDDAVELASARRGLRSLGITGD